MAVDIVAIVGEEEEDSDSLDRIVDKLLILTEVEVEDRIGLWSHLLSVAREEVDEGATERVLDPAILLVGSQSGEEFGDDRLHLVRTERQDAEESMQTILGGVDIASILETLNNIEGEGVDRGVVGLLEGDEISIGLADDSLDTVSHTVLGTLATGDDRATLDDIDTDTSDGVEKFLRAIALEVLTEPYAHSSPDSIEEGDDPLGVSVGEHKTSWCENLVVIELTESETDDVWRDKVACRHIGEDLRSDEDETALHAVLLLSLDDLDLDLDALDGDNLAADRLVFADRVGVGAGDMEEETLVGHDVETVVLEFVTSDAESMNFADVVEFSDNRGEVLSDDRSSVGLLLDNTFNFSRDGVVELRVEHFDVVFDTFVFDDKKVFRTVFASSLDLEFTFNSLGWSFSFW